MKTIGERIRQAREAKGLSQAELAKLAGYKNQSSIGNLENRASVRGGYKLDVIAKALGVTQEWLLTGEDSLHHPQASHRVTTEAPPPYLVGKAPQDKAQGTPLADALRELGRHFIGLDDTGKRRAAPLLADLVHEPGQYQSLAVALESVLASSKQRAA